MANKRVGFDEVGEYDGEMYYADYLTERDKEMFRSGFEFACIIDAIVNQINFYGPIEIENIDRVKDTMNDLGLDYTLEPKEQDDGETEWLLTLEFHD